MPGFPRLKEWAYAGIVFDLTGAVASHAAYGDVAWHILAPAILAVLAVASWALRPPSRIGRYPGRREGRPGLSADEETLAKLFDGARPHLQGVAYRMLGSLPEADDAVQEAWLRLSRSDTAAVENLTGVATTVVARICLDALRSRKTRLERDAESSASVPQATTVDPEREALLAESIGLALLVVLQALDPAERIAFVLHDLFAVPFDEVASIVGRSPDAARQLASRARRRVRGAEPATDGAGLTDQRRLVEAFLAALRSADFAGLVAVLGPEFVMRADATASPPNGSEVRGAETWAKQALAWARGAKAARPVFVNGRVGVVLAPRGRLQRVLLFTFGDGRIAHAEIVADPERLRQLDLSVLPGLRQPVLRVTRSGTRASSLRPTLRPSRQRPWRRAPSSPPRRGHSALARETRAACRRTERAPPPPSSA